MNIRLDLAQGKYYMKIKTWEQIVMLLWVGILYILDQTVRWTIQDRFSRLQFFCSCLWVLLTWMICFLLNRQFTWFQCNRIDTLKMFGMSNLAIFFVNVYYNRYLYFLLMGFYAVLNVFLIDAPVLALLLIEFFVYWYIFMFVYYVKTWHYYRMKLGRTFYWLKKILVHFSILAMLVFIFFQEQMQVLLYAKKLFFTCSHYVSHIIEVTNHKIGMLFALGFMVLTEFYYIRFIYGHALYGEEEISINIFNKKASFRDAILRFDGGRIAQIIKLNYILYTRNGNCIITKLFLGVIWAVIVFYCNSRQFCFTSGMIIIAVLSAIVMYRIREDLENRKIYGSIGCTVKKLFIYHSISGLVYVNSLSVITIMFGVIIGKFDMKSVGLMVLWMAFQTIFFISFNFYFILVRKVNVNSQLYEMFEYFIGITISITLLSFVAVIIFLVKIGKYGADKAEPENRSKRYD